MSRDTDRKVQDSFEAHFGEVDVPPPGEPIEIWAPGSTAHLGDIKVSVLRAMIARSGVKYEVSWIHGGDRKECWVEGFELREGSREQRVGFFWGRARGVGEAP